MPQTQLEVRQPELSEPIDFTTAGGQHVAAIIRELGENVSRPGLRETPTRAWETLRFLTDGYSHSVEEIVGDAIFSEAFEGTVTVNNIDFYSLCEHHLLPFFGEAHVEYRPNGRILGLSKIPRIVDMFARRLQIQERMTQQIAGAIWDVLSPKGVSVRVEGAHLCMMMRGVEKKGARTITQATLGNMETDPEARPEYSGPTLTAIDGRRDAYR